MAEVEDIGRMRTAGPEGAPNLVGEWLPHQVAAHGGNLREDTGVPLVVVGSRGEVMKGKGLAHLYKRYGVK